MREPTYGEVAYHCLQGRVGSLLSFDQLSVASQEAWENTAASVIAEFRKRQLALSRQTNPWRAFSTEDLQYLADELKAHNSGAEPNTFMGNLLAELNSRS